MPVSTDREVAPKGVDEAHTIAASLLATEHPRRWRHVQAVAAEADRLARAVGIEPRPVVCSAWLHDIGYAAQLYDTGYHPIDGARYLRRNGWDDEVCRLVAHHTNASQRAEELGSARLLNAEFPNIDGIAQDVLWTADATTGPTGEHMTLDERIAELAARHGADSHAARSKLASRPHLLAAITRTAARIQDTL